MFLTEYLQGVGHDDPHRQRIVLLCLLAPGGLELVDMVLTN
jgi:hypothetical protein